MNITINSFIRKTADKMRETGQYSAAKSCMSALNGLLKTAGKSTLHFSELTPALLKAYDVIGNFEASKNSKVKASV